MSNSKAAMKKLFDETNAYDARNYRTVWYGYMPAALDATLVETIAALVADDLDNEPEPAADAAHWVFYSEEQTRDALNETLRPSQMIRYRDGEYKAIFNTSDYDFVTILDDILSFTKEIEKRLSMSK